MADGWSVAVTGSKGSDARIADTGSVCGVGCVEVLVMSLLATAQGDGIHRMRGRRATVGAGLKQGSCWKHESSTPRQK